MVVFTCNHCGDSLQKPKVEKHYQLVCRTTKNLTCVDCFKDFREEEYVAHIKCITEEERYAAKGSIPNGIIKKGEVKQESWVEMIKSILDKEKNLQPPHRNLLNTISAFSNVPRKKQKFINFVKSSSGGRSKMQDIEAVWDIIEKYKLSQKQDATQIKADEGTASNGKANGEDSNQQEAENKKTKKKRKYSEVEDNNETTINGKNSEQGETEKNKKKKNHNDVEDNGETTTNGEDNNNHQEAETKKNKKKRKHIEVDGENDLNSNENIAENGVCMSKKDRKKETSEDVGPVDIEKFNYEEAITNILKEKPSISLKKLEKKFLKLYKNHYGDVDDLEKVGKKFNKKLKKLANVTIQNDHVVLAQ